MKLYEVSIPELLKATKTEFKSDRELESRNVRIINKKFIPSYKESNLTCVAQTQTTSNRYTTKIEINDVVFDDRENSTSVMGADNRPVTFIPCDYMRCSVKVSCNCLDYYQRMASYNKSNNTLIGDVTPSHYNSPVTPGNKAKGNPNNSIGVCKHIIALVIELKHEKVLK